MTLKRGQPGNPAGGGSPREDHPSPIADDPALVNLNQRTDDFEIGGFWGEDSFTRRLARNNGCSVVFAWHVVQEYKRFRCLLAVDGDRKPSDDVLKAWHLHVISTPLDPLDHSYEQNLKSYEQFFGHPPTKDVCAPPADRLIVFGFSANRPGGA